MDQLIGRLVMFDIESSGLDVETERIVSLSACVVDEHGNTETFNELVNPGVLIPASDNTAHRAVITHHILERRPRSVDGRPRRDGPNVVLVLLNHKIRFLALDDALS